MIPIMIDTHAHLDMQDYDEDRKEVIERARQGGISHIISVGIDLQSSQKALELANSHDFIFSTVGFHPHNADHVDPGDLEGLAALTGEPRVVAWGEIGLDFYRGWSQPDKQREAFEKQIDLARHCDLPLVIHCREAHEDLLEILKRKENGPYQGVIHCFSGDYKLAMNLIAMGFYISIPGTVTYKKAVQVQDVAARIPLERLLLETDAPFLAPVPKRGKRNEPLFVVHTAKKIAELRKIDYEEVGFQTSQNAIKLFALPAKQ
ncbi:MAG: TatD family hydrolase [Deltaproteobacteria bacterium]|nr:TatD family hydrolase [Deltaproteobacteria bacterium]